MIIGTAGHVDHGKTALVRALTGVDTDRLPEEKARGISIVLGYAYAPLPNGEVLGFVDVPGHEKFLPTMLAGATGIDFALLVVAADDGPMPQTREHLDILGLLGVRAGAVALSKIDAVDDARAAEAANAIATLLAASPLAACPIFPVSTRSGSGVDALRAHLHAQALAHRRPGADAPFRLAVDRAFTLAGIGTVVTGTVHSGCLNVGESVAIAPQGGGARVRSIHAQDRPSPSARAGQRCALNLAGLALEQVRRGDWVVAPGSVLATQRCDGHFTLLAGEAQALRSGSAVHVHLGAAHVPGHIVVLGGSGAAGSTDAARPGERCFVQLVLQRAVAAWHGDHFIVRDGAAARTLGGGRVLDPFAPARHRRGAQRLSVLAALDVADPGQRLAALVGQAPEGVDVRSFALAGNVGAVQPVVDAQSVRRIRTAEQDFAVAEPQWRGLREAARAALARLHEMHPDDAGADRTRLKRAAFARLSVAVYEALIAECIADGVIQSSGPWLHLPEHGGEPSAEEQAVLQRIVPLLATGRFDPPWVRDLARDTAQHETRVRAALMRGAQRGLVYQVVRDLFFHPAAIHELASLVRRLHAADGAVRAAPFRDATGLGRKRAIQILEFFDRIGLLRRIGDRHLVRPNDLLDLGRDGGSTQNALDTMDPAKDFARTSAAFLPPAALASQPHPSDMR
jgi:selenocysteine-specific elongation factor